MLKSLFAAKNNSSLDLLGRSGRRDHFPLSENWNTVTAIIKTKIKIKIILKY
jgi:hypothetical protein